MTRSVGALVAARSPLPGPATGPRTQQLVRGTGDDDELYGTSGADILQGLGGEDSLEGLGGDDQLEGGMGDDALDGGTGNDTLDGKAGRDTLNGGAGLDTFRFSTAPAATNADRIADFVSADDRIVLDDAVFAGIGPVGALSAAAFRAGTAALDASDRVIYNAAAGQLLYDADGTGAGAAVLFATVAPNTVLTLGDFFVG